MSLYNHRTNPTATYTPDMTYAVDYLHQDHGPDLGIAVAIRDFMKAWLRHARADKLIAHSTHAPSLNHFIDLAREQGLDGIERCGLINPNVNPQELMRLSCLFLPDPDMVSPAWRRATMKSGHALCGLVHTMSGERVARVMRDLLIAPTRCSDALICPSRAIRDTVLKIWETQSDYIRHRFGSAFAPPIQTPVIPLGIDAARFKALRTEDKRKAQRAALTIADDEVVILFYGRLNFATKAHPLPLLLAAAKAAQKTNKKLRVVFYGYFMPKEEMQPRFSALIGEMASAIKADIVENTDARFPEGFWAGADIFASVVDNVQESFGLTPLEAMACGLPVVVTDWDGYRDGVRHNQDGFLIPTLMPPASAGADIINAFFNNAHYGQYLTGAAQSTAIDIDAAAAAFETLANDPALRRRMGASGQERIQQSYDWRVIIPAYEELWEALGQQAAKETPAASLPDGWDAASPSHPNPYNVFQNFPSRTLLPSDQITITMSADDLAFVLRHDMNLFAPDLLLPLPLLHTLIDTLRAHLALPIETLLSVTPPMEHQRLWRTVGWLLKHGVAKVI